MKRLNLWKRLLGLALAGLVMMVGPAAVPRPASAQDCAWRDPVGDVNFHAPAYRDIVCSEIQKNEDGTFSLRMEMKGSVPERPPLTPPGKSEIWWVWGFNFDPTTFPHGYPFPPGQGLPLPAEFMVYVAWDGYQFTGTAIDRRPLLTGQDAFVTSVPFSIDGAIVQATLTPPSDFPASFGWGTRAYDWSSPPGKTGGIKTIDTSQPFFTPFP